MEPMSDERWEALCAIRCTTLDPRWSVDACREIECEMDRLREEVKALRAVAKTTHHPNSILIIEFLKKNYFSWSANPNAANTLTYQLDEFFELMDAEDAESNVRP